MILFQKTGFKSVQIGNDDNESDVHLKVRDVTQSTWNLRNVDHERRYWRLCKQF